LIKTRTAHSLLKK